VPDSLAKCIAAFGNTDGGAIIIGYSQRHKKLFSSSWKDHGIVEKSIRDLDDPPKINIYDVQYKGFMLTIVEVTKNSGNLTYYKGALYIRVGDQVSLMSKGAIKMAFNSKINNSSDVLLLAIEKMNIKNEDLRNQLDAHNLWAIDNSKKITNMGNSFMRCRLYIRSCTRRTYQ